MENGGIYHETPLPHLRIFPGAMASAMRVKCHLHDIQVHKSAVHPDHSQGGDYLHDPEGRGKYEVNGNYAINPELVESPGPLGARPVCSCSGSPDQMEEATTTTAASALPNGVTGKVHSSEKSHVTFSMLKEEEEEGAGDPDTLRHGASKVRVSGEVGKSKGRGGGHCQRSKEVMEKFPALSHVIEEQPTSPHILERSNSYSTVERSLTKDLLSQMKEALSLGHAAKEDPPGQSHDPDLPPSSADTDVDANDADNVTGAVSDSDDRCPTDADKAATSESEPEHNDVSKSSEDETVPDISLPAAISKKALCLPRPFRFKDRKSKDSEKVTDKPPLGPSALRGGKGRAPPPRQSWLLRLFESKLFDMSIAISYLFNSKEPGVQTYLGEP